MPTIPKVIATVTFSLGPHSGAGGGGGDGLGGEGGRNGGGGFGGGLRPPGGRGGLGGGGGGEGLGAGTVAPPGHCVGAYGLTEHGVLIAEKEV